MLRSRRSARQHQKRSPRSSLPVWIRLSVTLGARSADEAGPCLMRGHQPHIFSEERIAPPTRIEPACPVGHALRRCTLPIVHMVKSLRPGRCWTTALALPIPPPGQGVGRSAAGACIRTIRTPALICGQSRYWRTQRIALASERGPHTQRSNLAPQRLWYALRCSGA